MKLLRVTYGLQYVFSLFFEKLAHCVRLPLMVVVTELHSSIWSGFGHTRTGGQPQQPQRRKQINLPTYVKKRMDGEIFQFGDEGGQQRPQPQPHSPRPLRPSPQVLRSKGEITPQPPLLFKPSKYPLQFLKVFCSFWRAEIQSGPNLILTGRSFIAS